MIKSELILPIRFYDNVFEQNRFNKFIESNAECDMPLVYPANGLPHFQFTRDKSLNTVSKFYLRNICNDYVRSFMVGGDYLIDRRFGKELNEPAAHMSETDFEAALGIEFPYDLGGIFDDGVNPPSGMVQTGALIMDCNRLKNGSIDPDVTITNSGIEIPITSATAKYTFKIIVEEFSTSGDFEIKIYNGGTGGTLIGTITAPGIYTYSFTSTANDITITFEDLTIADSFSISYMQAVKDIYTDMIAGDVELDETDVKITALENGTDILSFCDTTTYNVPKGQYYYIVVTGDIFYFSEVFQIKPLVELENYYKLEWYNSCDIRNNVIFNSDTLSCNFRNILYLDAALFNPQYLTDEEVDKNGQGEEIPKFRRWQKTRNLDVVCPEFMADVLTGIFLHEFIYLTEPLNKYQEIQSEAVRINKTESAVSSIVLDRAQRVILQLVLDSKLTQAGCCDSVEQLDCSPQDYTADDCTDEDYYLVTSGSDEEIGLFTCADNEKVEVDSSEIIYNAVDGYYYQLSKVGSLYDVARVMPKITNVTTVGPNYIITGTVFPNTWVNLYSNIDGAGYVLRAEIEVDESGNFTASLPTSLSTGATDFKFKIENSSLYCEFGEDIYDVI